MIRGGRSLSPVTEENVETQIDLLRVFQSGQNHPYQLMSLATITIETKNFPRGTVSYPFNVGFVFFF